MALPNANQINTSYMIDPNEELYNIEGKTGEVDVEAFATDDDDKKSSLKSTDYIPSGSATVDLSEEAQVNNLLKYDATTGEAYVDNFSDAVDIYQGITTDLNYMRNYDSNKSMSQQSGTGSPKSFDNINSDNFFEKNVGSIQGTATTIAKKIGGIYSLDKGPEGAFISGMVGSIIGGGFPLGTAAVWMAYGYQQEKDKNDFIKKLSNGGITQLLADPNKGYKYTGKNDMTASQYMNHILFNSFNPGYDLKKYADMGKSPQEALANFMNVGIDNGVFSQQSILKMGSMRHEMQPGSDSYMKAWAAEKALKDKGWTGKGRLWTDPDGNQWLDGNLWKPIKTQTSDTSGTGTSGTDTSDSGSMANIGSSISNVTGGSGGISYDPGTGYQFSGQPVGNPAGEQTNTGSGSSSSGSSSSIPSGNTPGFSGNPNIDRKLGGVVRLQQGGSPEEAMMAQMQNQQVEEAGNLEMVNEPNKDMSGVADDVPRQLEEGDFVINAPAVEMAGRSDVERMVTKAITELQRKGVKLDFGTTTDDIDSMVDALVSNGEMIIPKVLAEQIGYDRLEKINNRGKERVEAKEKERQQIQQNPTQPNPQGMMAVGGQVSLDENKNQPIAVPQESFAGQSSVGSKLLSPMSPEAQDDEKELTDRSQSFEGFMKPVKLASGDMVKNSFNKDEIDRLIFKESSNRPDVIVKNEKEHSVGLMQVGQLALTDVNKKYGTNYTLEQLTNPNINREVGTNYLNMLLEKYGNKQLALAAYNYGMKNVGKDTNNDVKNFNNLPKSVQDYVKNILNIQVIEQPKINTINPSGIMGK
jgi:hypothetical protein